MVATIWVANCCIFTEAVEVLAEDPRNAPDCIPLKIKTAMMSIRITPPIRMSGRISFGLIRCGFSSDMLVLSDSIIRLKLVDIENWLLIDGEDKGNNPSFY